nr:hypothetical protein [Tanacetum cinerariifolium]
DDEKSEGDSIEYPTSRGDDDVDDDGDDLSEDDADDEDEKESSDTESRRAEDRLIGRLKRERRYFCTLSTTYEQEVVHSHDYCTQIMDYCQS